jgi:hypothetical protein
MTSLLTRLGAIAAVLAASGCASLTAPPADAHSHQAMHCKHVAAMHGAQEPGRAKMDHGGMMAACPRDAAAKETPGGATDHSKHQ